MADPRKYLSSLTKEDRRALELRLHSRQPGKCFICELPIDLTLHHGQLDIDHIIPVSEKGADEENNYALNVIDLRNSHWKPPLGDFQSG